MSGIPLPLPSDEGRRATATTEGYIFQWWLSVLAWLELADSEALYLESSEDFEVTTAGAGKTVQAKAGVSRSLTLRSDDVVAALNHFWELAAQEQRTVRFVLLAQADAVVERGAPFGAGSAGLKLWQEAGTTRQPETIERLQRFLREDSQVAPRLLPGLREFVRTASAAEFSARLVQAITFDLGREPTGVVKQLVMDRLIVLAADRHGASVAEAERVADTLFSQVVHLAANKERVPLTRAQLLHLLETLIVKFREHLHLALPPVAAAAALVEASGGALWEASADDLRLPPLPIQLLQRPELVGKLRAHLDGKSLLVLFGSTGMGKTTLAKQVAASSGGRWRWLDLQGYPVAAMQVALRRVLAVADRHRNAPFDLVVDGYSPDGLPAAILNTLRAISFLVQCRGGRVIVTTQRLLTSTEVAGLGWKDLTSITAPRMESEEITRFATELGCADQTDAQVWGLAVHAHTDGHPQLVHAACLWLQQKRWPKFDGQTFRDSANTVETERAQARRLVARLAGDELELLARLSVLGSTFRREHALALAEKLERLPGAPFRFDSLLGPWIEPGDARGYHRLSPLLDDRTVAPARRVELETACAQARLESTPVYVHDAALALRHALNAANTQLAAQIAAKFLLTLKHERGEAYWHLLWLTSFSAEELERMFSGHRVFESFIHLLRFQIAAELLPENVVPFIAAAETSLAKVSPDLNAGMRFAFLCEVLIAGGKSLPTREMLRYLEDAAVLAPQVGSEADVAVWFPRVLLPPALRLLPPADHLRVSLAALVLSNTPGREIVTGMMEALEALPEERRKRLICAFGAWPTLFCLVWDRVWLLESEKPTPDWERLLAWFAAAVATGIRWQAEEVVVAAARAASIVCNEYLNDPDRAERVLADIGATIPAYVAALFDQRAKIAAERKNYAAALEAVRKALPRWDDSDYGGAGKMHSLQRAGVWAGKLEQWKDSAGFFAQGVDSARKGKHIVAQAGLETDAGVALWFAREKKAAIDSFARAIHLCRGMRPPGEDLATFQFQKLLGHIVHTFAMAGRRRPDSAPQAPVVPGIASEPAVNEKVKTLPPPQLDLCKIFLAMLEHNHQLGEACWEQYREEGLASRSLATRQFALELATRKTIRRGDCAELPALAAQQASVFAAGMKMASERSLTLDEHTEFPPASVPFDHDAAGARLFLAGLVSVSTQRGNLANALSDLDANADKSPFPNDLKRWIQRARTVLGAPESELISISGGGELAEDRVIAGLTLLTQPKLAPESLWSALYIVASSLNRMWWGADVMLPFDQLAGERWRQAAENRSMFRNPTLWLPDLKALCREPVRGNQRFARLMLAALPALKLQTDPNIAKELQQMRDGTLDTGWQRIAPRLADAL